LNRQSDAARGAATSQKQISESQPYQSPDSQLKLESKKQPQPPDLPSRHAHVASSAASDNNAQM